MRITLCYGWSSRATTLALSVPLAAGRPDCSEPSVADCHPSYLMRRYPSISTLGPSRRRLKRNALPAWPRHLSARFAAPAPPRTPDGRDLVPPTSYPRICWPCWGIAHPATFACVTPWITSSTRPATHASARRFSACYGAFAAIPTFPSSALPASHSGSSRGCPRAPAPPFRMSS